MTRKITRRGFGKGLGAVSVAAVTWRARPARAAKAKVVVVGGGPGGATVARYIAKDSDEIEVTLVEENKTYTTCFFSNLYLGGFRTFDSITHSYDRLSGDYGINVVQARAEAVDPEKRQVRLAGGDSLDYDRLVVAPGIDLKYETIEGYSEAAAQVMPHAWKAGAQSQILKAQLEAMDDGGTFVIAPPPNPYRCPPGPYERVSMVAHYFKQHKPSSKIVILDSKNKFSKQKLFEDGWARFYEDMVEWLPAEMTGGVRAVDTNKMTVQVDDETFEAAVANIIPAQQCGAIARQAGLANESGWCPVQAETLESKMMPGIHIVGDAIVPGDMPKSAFSANSQAKVCAMAIRAELTGSKAFKPRFRNTCWSLIATDHGVKVGANYQATEEKIAKVDGFISQADETDETRAATAEEGNGWYAGITKDVFG
ncbi:MAG: FCSD flavin-binding domain-containing protein [Kiloniellales bacterium]|nr:FCSD flavin-binding domain-containing protein [Kiloniellales bacterium]